MNKYNNSKIYKIVSSETDKIYIGSTIRTIEQRFLHHISDYKMWMKDNTKGYMTSYEILKHGNYKIELIECVNVETRQDLLKLEGKYQRLNESKIVNLIIAGGDIIRKEKLIENPIKKEIVESVYDKYLCSCGSIYSEHKKLRHIRTKKHRDFYGITCEDFNFQSVYSE